MDTPSPPELQGYQKEIADFITEHYIPASIADADIILPTTMLNNRLQEHLPFPIMDAELYSVMKRLGYKSEDFGTVEFAWLIGNKPSTVTPVL